METAYVITARQLVKILDDECGQRAASGLDDAAEHIGVNLAFAHGWTSEHDDGLEPDEPIPGDADVIRALRQPCPIAAVFAAMAERLGLAVPELITRAMTDCEPLPA